jgi:hypothetical protein
MNIRSEHLFEISTIDHLQEGLGSGRGFTHQSWLAHP